MKLSGYLFLCYILWAPTEQAAIDTRRLKGSHPHLHGEESSQTILQRPLDAADNACRQSASELRSRGPRANAPPGLTVRRASGRHSVATRSPHGRHTVATWFFLYFLNFSCKGKPLQKHTFIHRILLFPPAGGN